MPHRLWLLAFCFTTIFMVFVGRLFQLQIMQGSSYDDKIHQDRLIEEMLPARRGRILDRHGTVLVDNKPIYHLAIVLRDLEVDQRQRRRWPFLRFDEATCDRVVAEMASHLARPAADMRRILFDELERSPSVAIRHRERERNEVGLVAVPRSAAELNPEAMATAGELQLLGPSLRRAIVQEISRSWGSPPLVCTRAELADALAQIDSQFDCGSGFSLHVIEAFLYQITVDLPDDQQSNWVVLTPERRLLAEDALARALVVKRSAISLPLDRALAAIRRDLTFDQHDAWYFAPASLGQRLADILPGEVEMRAMPVRGAPGSRERIYYLQGDPPDADDGLFSLFCRRLQASLGTRGDWVQALLLQEARSESGFSIVRRFHPQHLVVFDHHRLATFCNNLAGRLLIQGIDKDALAIEGMICAARRRADRAWAGATASDPIPFLENIDKHLAITLAPDAASLPQPYVDRYSATETPLPGLQVVNELGREYRFNGSAVHMIGHMGRLSASYDRDEALLQGLDPEGWKGTSGLELVFDTLLHGVTGRRIRLLSADGTREHIDAPAPGQDLRTTIDIDLQRDTEHALQNWFELAEQHNLATEKMRRGRNIGRGRAGMVIMDPWSGEILAMASRPGYTHEELRQHYQLLAEDPAQPLLDHSCTASQPPGSTMKILVGIAAFAEGVYRVGEVIHSAGHLGTMGDHAPAGDYDMARAIQLSSNVFFAEMALRLGPERVVDWFFRAGSARKTSPDIPWQRLQFITRTPQNIVTSRPREPFWTRGDTRRLGIGNFWASSPLEVVQVAALAATTGNIVTPHLVPGLDDDGNDKAEPHDRISLTQAQWHEIRDGMERACAPGGTAPQMFLETEVGRIVVAGKTGTSEWGNRRSRRLGLTPDHAWLMGYAPADNPTICFAIFIHSGTSGGRACTGAARHVLESYFNRYGRDGHRVDKQVASTR